MKQPTYPDISTLLSAKAERREATAALSWEEKVAIVERMRNLLPRDMWRDRPAEGELPTNRTSPAERRPTRGPR